MTHSHPDITDTKFTDSFQSLPEKSSVCKGPPMFFFLESHLWKAEMYIVVATQLLLLLRSCCFLHACGRTYDWDLSQESAQLAMVYMFSHAHSPRRNSTAFSSWKNDESHKTHCTTTTIAMELAIAGLFSVCSSSGRFYAVLASKDCCAMRRENCTSCVFCICSRRSHLIQSHI